MKFLFLMVRKLFFIFCFTVLGLGYTIQTSCVIEEPLISTEHILSNNSQFKITLYSYSRGDTHDSISLDAGTQKTSEYYEEGTIGACPYSGGDSVIVVYNNNDSITHYPWNWSGTNVERSIMNEENWLGGKTGENFYRYQYTFTDADYQEAVEANSGK